MSTVTGHTSRSTPIATARSLTAMDRMHASRAIGISPALLASARAICCLALTMAAASQIRCAVPCTSLCGIVVCCARSAIWRYAPSALCRTQSVATRKFPNVLAARVTGHLPDLMELACWYVRAIGHIQHRTIFKD